VRIKEADANHLACEKEAKKLTLPGAAKEVKKDHSFGKP